MSDPARPKLCYVIWEFERNTDRHYYHLYELLELLAKDLDLYVISLGGDLPDIPGISHAAVMTREGRGKSTYRRYGVPSLRESLGALLHARRLGYRTFFIHYSFAVARRAAILARLSGAKVFLWHSILVHKLLEDVGGGRRAVPLHHLTFRLVHGVVTSSPYMKRYYETEWRLPPRKVKVVRSSISLARFDPGAFDREAERRRLGYGPGDIVVLWVHGLERGKGCLEIPEISSLIRARVPNAHFEIVGDGTRREAIEEELARRQMTDRVHMRGRVANSDVMAYYAAADLFIMPSRFEEFSRVLLEAMAMGVPFVSSDGSGPIHAIVSDRQRLCIVPALRTAEFASRCVKLLEDPAERAALAAHGRDHVRRYTLERARDEFLMEVMGMDLRPPSDGGAAR